jgi:hypothetical protein
MKKFPLLLSALLFSLPTLAADAPAATQPPAKSSARIYGYQLMTPEERNEYRAKMRDAKTPEERQAICEEHHTQMQARAKEKGVTLPERARCGAGRNGPRGGMGPGQGRGPMSGPPAGQ